MSTYLLELTFLLSLIGCFWPSCGFLQMTVGALGGGKGAWGLCKLSGKVAKAVKRGLAWCGTVYQSKHLTPTVEHDGGGLMIWTCFAAVGLVALAVFMASEALTPLVLEKETHKPKIEDLFWNLTFETLNCVIINSVHFKSRSTWMEMITT